VHLSNQLVLLKFCDLGFLGGLLLPHPLEKLWNTVSQRHFWLVAEQRTRRSPVASA